jgi:hypothetical protein
MMPGKYPLSLYHGDSYEWQFKLWLDEGKTQPLDLADATPKAEIRDKPGGMQIYALDCSIQPPNIISVALSAATCTTLPISATMAWDLQLSYSSGAVNTILSGTVSVTEDVTDSTIGDIINPTQTKPVLIRAPRAVTGR